MISIPEHRNFCDLRFNHGCPIGSLLGCDDSSDIYGLRDKQYAPNDTESLMDDRERDTELGRGSGSMGGDNTTDDRMEHNGESELNIEHTLDSAGPIPEHTQEFTTEQSVEQNLAEGAAEVVPKETNCDSQLSIDEYLELCVQYLNFTEIDVMFAKYLYNEICHAGVMGVPQLHLEQVCQTCWIVLINAHMCL